MRCPAQTWLPSDDPYCGINLECLLPETHEGPHECTISGIKDGLNKSIQFETDTLVKVRWEVIDVHDNQNMA